MQRLLSTVLISTALLGCKIKKHEPDGDKSAAQHKDVPVTASKTTSPEAVALRDEVLAKVRVWDRHYAPTDLSLVDPAIEHALYVNGKAADKRDTVIQQAADGVYAALTRDAAGLAVLEKLVTERYNAPVITRDGDLVRIDLGVVPGSMMTTRWGLTVTSKVTENGNESLLASELVRVLKAAIAAQPGAKIYQVDVDMPGRWGKGQFSYVYDTAADRIRVYQHDKPDAVYTTETLGGALDKLTTVLPSKLTKRPLDKLPIRVIDLKNQPG